jgi:hypothetical protein
MSLWESFRRSAEDKDPARSGFSSLSDAGRRSFDDKFDMPTVEAADFAGGTVSANDRTFHGGGPTGAGPFAGKKEIPEGGNRSGALRLKAGRRNEGGPRFPNDVRGDAVGLTDAWLKFRQFMQNEIHYIFAAHLLKAAGNAHDYAEDRAFRSRIEPLDGATEQGGVREMGDAAIETKVNASDG